MKSNPSTRRVNVRRLKPVAGPSARSSDPDENAPPCPQCGGPDTLWYVDARTTRPVLVCARCTRWAPVTANVKGGGRHG